VLLAERVVDDVAEAFVVTEQVDERGAETRQSQLLGLGHVGLWVGLVAPQSRATTIVTSVGHALYDARPVKL
jgi:hypothetical protein